MPAACARAGIDFATLMRSPIATPQIAALPAAAHLKLYYRGKDAFLAADREFAALLGSRYATMREPGGTPVAIAIHQTGAAEAMIQLKLYE
jgi:hypothetical protein